MNNSNAVKAIEKRFPFYLRRSFYIHAALVVCTLIGGKVAYEIAQKQREANLELIQASVRVDMVAMPKYTIAELKNISRGNQDSAPEEEKVEEEVKAEEKTEEVAKNEEPAPEAKAEVAEADTPDPVAAFEKEAAEKKQNFLAKLQKLSKQKVPDSKSGENKSKTKKDRKGETGYNGVDSTALKNLVLSGNKLSQGTALTGDGSSGNMTAFQIYASQIPDMVRPHWTLPQYLLDKNLQCRVRVWLDDMGDVVRAEIYKSSGDQDYDQRAVRAVKSASPFPPLSKDLGQRAQNGDILLGFPL